MKLITFISAIWYTKNTPNDEFEKAEKKHSSCQPKQAHQKLKAI